MNTQSVSILLIDDDDVSAESVERGLRQARIANPMFRARHGEEGLGMLRGAAGLPAVPRPYVILLDLNMPRMNGHEFLAELRADPELSGSVVFVLTTSESAGDREAAYAQHVAGYCVKDQAGRDFVRLIDMLDQYWQVVVLPEE